MRRIAALWLGELEALPVEVKAFGALGLGLIPLLLIPTMMLLLLACAPTPAGQVSSLGSWVQVQTPPGVPADLQCWVWQAGMGSGSIGGPTCFSSTPKSP